LKVICDWFPALSLATHATGVVPTANVLPDAGVHVGVMQGVDAGAHAGGEEEQSTWSFAIGENVTVVATELWTLMSANGAKTGGTVSETVTVKG
jgi:hypothetical protein